MKNFIPLFFLSFGLCSLGHAGDLSSLGTLTQAEFRAISEDLGAALSYKPLSPTASQGITGFDVGIEVTGTDISKSAAALSKAGASNSTMDTLLVPRLHVHKGLPLGIDVAGFIANIPVINGQLIGAELRYAFVEGGITTPAIGMRLAGTQLNGVGQLAFNTRSVDISISKGFTVLTPYAGIGQVWSHSSPHEGSLASETLSQGKLFAGLNINMGLLNLALEADKTGNTSSWGVKLGLRW